MKRLPKISVNIPLITNGDASIVLNSLKKVKYPKKLIEIIIIEGNQIAKQRNIGIKNSTGSIIYLLDDDSRVNHNSFKIIAEKFSDPKVATLGGPSLIPKNNKNYLNSLIYYALGTMFGAMRMRYRYSKQIDTKGSEYRLIGANLALRKSAVLKVGGVNELIVPNEETELLRRLEKKGYKLLYDKNLYIYRNHRENLVKLAKQFCHYGRGRVKQMKNSPKTEDLLFLLPAGFFLYLITLTLYHPAWYLAPLFIYTLVGIATSVKAAIKYRKPDLLIALSIIFPVIHLSYTYGLIEGFFQIEDSIKGMGKLTFNTKKVNL